MKALVSYRDRCGWSEQSRGEGTPLPPRYSPLRQLRRRRALFAPLHLIFDRPGR